MADVTDEAVVAIGLRLAQRRGLRRGDIARPNAVALDVGLAKLGADGTPEDLKGPAVFLASDASNFVNGHILYVDGGILAYIGKQPQLMRAIFMLRSFLWQEGRSSCP